MRINIFLKLSLIFTAIALISISFNFLLVHDKNEILAQGIWQVTEEKCVIDAVIRNGFETGKIPIGETVDYAELYAREIIRNLNILIVNTEKAANTAYNEESEDDLYDLPPLIVCEKCEAACCECEVDDEGECIPPGECVCLECDCCATCDGGCPFSRCLCYSCSAAEGNRGRSTSGSCNCDCFCNAMKCTSGSCSCTVDCSDCKEDDEEFCMCKYICSCSNVKPFCEPLCKIASGVKIIQKAYEQIVIANNNITNLVDVEGKITLCDCPETNLGFVGSEIEIPEELNRWKIVNALTNSRNKLETCITGYEHVLDQGMAKMTLLNCMTALDEIETKEGMTILPGFEYFAATTTLEYLCFQDLAPIGSDYCYAYNSECFLTEKQRDDCRQNRGSTLCEEIIKDLMYNFFCCGGVIK